MQVQNEASQYFRQSLQQSVSNNFGDYEVGDQINHGGFGHIFKLKERKSKRIYALKVLDRTKKGEQIKIKNQINIHQSLKNRYILQLNNKFHDEMNYYMVLEYCEKGDLFTYLTKKFHTGMPFQQTQRFVEQIAKGISYLHKQDIVHGDIKPSNILINEKDQIKICDFGLSTKRKNKQKVNGAKGTLNYLAPQCIFPYDQKVDIWAFGVLIYFISTGTLPFQISTYKQLTQILTEQKLKKLQIPEKIPSKLRHLLKNIFVYDPKSRYSINDILKHPFLTGQELLEEEETIKQSKISRMRSYTSTTLQNSRTTEMFRTTSDINNENQKYNGRKSRPNSQNKQNENKKTKHVYMDKIMQKKMKFSHKNVLQDDKQNNMNLQNKQININLQNGQKSYRNTQKILKVQNKNTQKTLKMQKPFEKTKTTATLKRSISPLKTLNMIIKPIISKQKNYITKIDAQGISHYRQQLDKQNKIVKIQIKVSPDGRAIFIRKNQNQTFYTLETLPERYYKQYQKCKKRVNSIKNHTPKLQFSKIYHQPVYKQINITVMYSGKVIGLINNQRLQTTQKQLQDCITFAQNQQKFINHQNMLMYQIKSLYQKLISMDQI